MADPGTGRPSIGWRHDRAGLVIEAAAYRLVFPTDRPYAELWDATGHRWAELALPWSIHRTDGLDSTTLLREPVVVEHKAGVAVTVEAASPLWETRLLRFRCDPEELGVSAEVVGSGRLTSCHLFGGHFQGTPSRGTGMLRSGRGFQSVFTPEPGPLDRLAASAWTALSIDVVGGSFPGRGHWFFTPAPFCFGFSRSGARPGAVPEGPWLMAGLAVGEREASFTAFHYEVEEEAWSFRLDYEGQTRIEGRFTTPEVRFRAGAPDPYTGIAWDRRALERDGLAPRADAGPTRPAWWRSPIFCGWGAQSAIAEAAARGSGAADPGERVRAGLPGTAELCTQDRYDAFLADLEARGLDPGIVTIDDRWQSDYGTNEVDTGRWPDLTGWISRQHEMGRRVLLWWKAWDPGRLEPGMCVRRRDGVPVAVDPTHRAYRALVRDTMRRLLGQDGHGADGLKVDFTAQTPSGPDLVREGRAWGVELLRELLALLGGAAMSVKPDALIVTHTPNPLLAPYAGMIRLNDALRLSDPRPWKGVVKQMRHRAAIVRAACPGHLIDTDNWAMPDLATFREYLAVQGELGVPALYYTTEIDQTGEPLEDRDFAAIRAVWEPFRPQGIKRALPA
jgi:hypothetical protein